MLDEQPRLFFVHFWADDDALKLAKGLQAALEKVAVTHWKRQCAPTFAKSSKELAKPCHADQRLLSAVACASPHQEQAHQAARQADARRLLSV